MIILCGQTLNHKLRTSSTICQVSGASVTQRLGCDTQSRSLPSILLSWHVVPVDCSAQFTGSQWTPHIHRHTSHSEVYGIELLLNKSADRQHRKHGIDTFQLQMGFKFQTRDFLLPFMHVEQWLRLCVLCVIRISIHAPKALCYQSKCVSNLGELALSQTSIWKQEQLLV